MQRKNLLHRSLLACTALLVIAAARQAAADQPAARPPNFIVIFADDLGYGDLGCYGHPTIRTPNLDRLAGEGVKFTQFYSAACVCTPSRAALLTGRLPIRSGMCSARPRVLFPESLGGLPAGEVTIAERLKEAGYATICIGKWHLGHLPQYLPKQQGFDEYFGLPYSNDMRGAPVTADGSRGEPLPLLRGESVVENNPDQGTLTERYTEEALKFIDAHRTEPFFIYLPHTMPHTPLHASEKFRGRSPRGLYGDVVETIDWSVGQILDRLEQHQLEDDTLVVFTSDNGPWLIKQSEGGSAGLLRDGKGCTFEGGMRVPGIVRWTGHVPPGRTTTALASTLDLLPTFCALAGVSPPDDRPLDGYDLSPLLLGKQDDSPRDTMYYYRGAELFAVRHGAWKLHFKTQPAYGPGGLQEHDPPLLYNLDMDPSERWNIAEQEPDVVAKIVALAAQHRAGVEPVENQLERKQ